MSESSDEKGFWCTGCKAFKEKLCSGIHVCPDCGEEPMLWPRSSVPSAADEQAWLDGLGEHTKAVMSRVDGCLREIRANLVTHARSNRAGYAFLDKVDLLIQCTDDIVDFKPDPKDTDVAQLLVQNATMALQIDELLRLLLRGLGPSVTAAYAEDTALLSRLSEALQHDHRQEDECCDLRVILDDASARWDRLLGVKGEDA